MKTRTQYLNGENSHFNYYAQFVDERKLENYLEKLISEISTENFDVIEKRLKSIVTQYDKKDYNPNALGLYFQAIEETVIPYFKKTGDIVLAIEKGFNDRLLGFILKKMGESFIEKRD